MKSYGESNVGKVRIKNDDSFYCSDGLRGIYIVADGMGGYQGGKLASQIAVDTAIKFFNLHSDIDSEKSKMLFLEIRKEFKKKISLNPDLKNMGTTFTSCIIQDRIVKCIHIGDSRAYLIEEEKIRQLTEDHTFVNILFKSGKLGYEDIKTHPKRNMLTKVLDSDSNMEPDFFEFEIKKKDYLLLCSDGLTNHLNDKEIFKHFNKEKKVNIIGRNLVKNAMENGGTDNIAVVLVEG